LLHWIGTSNPFYILSAGLFLVGLRVSFGAQARAIETWSLMSGLAAYTLLLAVTGYLLVRFGNVWDDVRTVLLLVVLMFLATSVTFDAVLVLNPERGRLCYLGGLLLAIAVSEGLLRGTRLLLPACFRVPYYSILALFFLYPLALRMLRDLPNNEALMWGLFGFSAAAGLVFLTLLPAIRRGPDYVRDNGSPWHWPWYPWALFVILGLAVPARAVLLCWSMHQLDNVRKFDQVIFGPYFLVPFGLAIAVLLLEIGLVGGQRRVLWTALAAPAGLVALALVGHRADPSYEEFRNLFAVRLGGDPLYLTLLASAGFYAYALLRDVSLASEALTVVLVALAIIAPDNLTRGDLGPPWAVPLLAAAALQLWLGLSRRDPLRCFLGAACLVAAVTLTVPRESEWEPFRLPLAFHLALVAVLGIGALFDGPLGRWFRTAGAALVLVAALAGLCGLVDVPDSLPPWVVEVYPLVLAVLLAAYGWLLGHWPSLVVAVVVLGCALVLIGWQGYLLLRQVVAGLDYLGLSLLLFALAVLISLAKSGVLRRYAVAREREGPPTTS